MITQETKPIKTWGGFNLAILKVNLNPLWKNRSYSTGLRPPTSYRYLPVETYWHDHVQALRPRTPSFLDSPASTSTPACVSLSFYCSNWMIIKFLRNLLLDNPKLVWKKTPQGSHKRFTQTAIWATSKTWLGFALYT